MSPIYFIANQIHKIFPVDTLVKLSVCTGFIKDKNQQYDFGGRVYYENDQVIVFHGLPKRIEIDGDNYTDMIRYEHNDLLSICYKLKQDKTCKFFEDHFEVQGKKYYGLDDLICFE